MIGKYMDIWMLRTKAWLIKKLTNVVYWLINHRQLDLAEKVIQFTKVRLLGEKPQHFCKWQISEINGELCLVCKDCGKIIRDNNAK